MDVAHANTDVPTAAPAAAAALSSPYPTQRRRPHVARPIGGSPDVKPTATAPQPSASGPMVDGVITAKSLACVPATDMIAATPSASQKAAAAEPQQSQSRPPRKLQPLPVCRYWVAGGSCRWGERCKFRHDAGVVVNTEAGEEASGPRPHRGRGGRRGGRTKSRPTAPAHPPVSPTPPSPSGQNPQATASPGPKATEQHRVVADGGGLKQDTAHGAQALVGSPGFVLAMAPATAQPQPQPQAHAQAPVPKQPQPQASPQRRPVARPPATIDGELAALRRLYPSSYSCDEGSIDASAGVGADSHAPRIIHLTIVPSDPDWPQFLGVCDVPVQLQLPAGYPLAALPPSLTVVQQSTPLSPAIPEPIAAHIDRCAAEQARQLHGKARGRPSLRPLLRWLDRNLEALFVEAAHSERRRREAQAAGFEFVPAAAAAANAEKKAAAVAPATDDRAAATSGYCAVPLATVQLAKGIGLPTARAGARPDTKVQEASHDAAAAAAALDVVAPDSLTAERRGTEVAAVGLRLGAASLLYTRVLACVLVCGRCKARADATLTRDKQGNPVACAMACSKCAARLAAAFRPAAAHSASHVLGYLDLDGCTALDVTLPRCSFGVECEACGRVNELTHVALDHEASLACRQCHACVTVTIPRVRFTRLTRGDTTGALAGARAAAGTETRRGRQRDEGLRPGQPLPDGGTCRHYKKSFRWLRFPCCGKLFPCDVCHDEATMAEHETVLANRMVCGFCSQEQPYGRAPCKACGKALTASAAGKVFWEGGQGCRDPGKLSKKDPHKRRLVRKQGDARAKEAAKQAAEAAKKAAKKVKAAALAPK